MTGFRPTTLTQAALDQRPEDTRRVHTANLRDLGSRHRLPVGNHRERFQGLQREALFRVLMKEPSHPLVQLGFRHDLVTAGDFDQLQSAGAVRPLFAEGRQCFFDVLARLTIENPRERLECQRLRRRKDQRFDRRLQVTQVIRHVSTPFVDVRRIRPAVLVQLAPMDVRFRVSLYSLFAEASGSFIGRGASAGRARL